MGKATPENLELLGLNDGRFNKGEYGTAINKKAGALRAEMGIRGVDDPSGIQAVSGETYYFPSQDDLAAEDLWSIHQDAHEECFDQFEEFLRDV